MAKDIRQAVMRAVIKAMFDMERYAKKLCPVDTGRLRSSIRTEISGNAVKISANTDYACAIGSNNHVVYNPETGKCHGIYHQNLDYVLSKDGKSHMVERKMKFNPKGKHIVEGIEISLSPKRRHIFVTPDHLILVLRDNNLCWIEAQDLSMTDYIFRRRQHNEVTNHSNEVIMKCINCHKDFYVLKHMLKFRTAKYCSQKCYHENTYHNRAEGKNWKLTDIQRIKYKGSNNSQWKGGISKLPYDWRFNEELKEMVKKRDKYSCQVCGSKNNLLVHHKDFDKMNSHINNLITWCRLCHTKFHARDNEFTSVNLNTFKPVHPIQIIQKKYKRKHKFSHLPKLYDLQIKDENSFLLNGILVHNSYVEFGTVRMRQRPFIRPALHFMVRKFLPDRIRQEVAKL